MLLFLLLGKIQEQKRLVQREGRELGQTNSHENSQDNVQ